MLLALTALLNLASAPVPTLQGVVYVDISAIPGGNGLSWATAYRDLNQALALIESSSGAFDEVWIAAGTYKPFSSPPASNPRERSYVLSSNYPTSLYGGFAGGETSLDERDPVANPTILSGDLAGDDQPGFVNLDENVFHVVRAIQAEFLLDGLVIEGGNADETQSNESGGGMFISTVGGYEIRDCVFRGNSSLRYGAAVYAFSSGDGIHGEVSGCDFSDNRVETNLGALYCSLGGHEGPATYVRDCVFSGNVAVTGGAPALYAAGASPFYLERCSFLGNDGVLRGAVLLNTRDGWIRGCRFEGNSGVEGGALSLGDSVSYNGDNRVENCLFRNNVATMKGAGIVVYSGGFTDVVHCTFTDNLSVLGSSIYAEEAIVDVRGSILWGNVATAGGDLDVDGLLSWFVVERSDVEGGWFGAGNLDVDPLFDADDALLAGSPCIDAGSAGDVEEALDLAGRPRLVDDPMTADTGPAPAPRPDMGASEYQTLLATPAELSTADGGQQTLSLAVPTALAGQLYWGLGSLSGTTPGLPYGGTLIALNPDVYFNYCTIHPSSPPLSGSLGNVPASGEVTAAFTLPAALYPQLAGSTVSHAFLVVDLGTLAISHSSNAVPLAFIP